MLPEKDENKKETIRLQVDKVSPTPNPSTKGEGSNMMSGTPNF